MLRLVSGVLDVERPLCRGDAESYRRERRWWDTIMFIKSREIRFRYFIGRCNVERTTSVVGPKGWYGAPRLPVPWGPWAPRLAFRWPPWAPRLPFRWARWGEGVSGAPGRERRVAPRELSVESLQLIIQRTCRRVGCIRLNAWLSAASLACTWKTAPQAWTKLH